MYYTLEYLCFIHAEKQCGLEFGKYKDIAYIKKIGTPLTAPKDNLHFFAFLMKYVYSMCYFSLYLRVTNSQ